MAVKLLVGAVVLMLGVLPPGWGGILPCRCRVPVSMSGGAVEAPKAPKAPKTPKAPLGVTEIFPV